MKGVKVVAEESQVIDALSQILHAPGKKVVALARRQKHPLPLSRLIDDGNENALQENYEEVLTQWISEERELFGAAAIREYQLEKAESELVERLAKSTYHQDWTIERCLESYPPGHFLG